MNTDPKTLSRIRRIEQTLEKMNIDLYPIAISDDAPLFPTSKSIWIDSGDMTLSFQYKIGNISMWVLMGELSIDKIIDLEDVDDTNYGDGKVLMVNTFTGMHEYVSLAQVAYDNSYNSLDDVPDLTVYQTKYSYVSVTISVADWAGGTTCTKTVAGVTATTWNDFAFAESYRDKIIEFDVRPSAQGAETITFTADSTPDAEIVLTVAITEV